MKLPHWLACDWGRWEQYEQEYGFVLFPGELIKTNYTRRRIRQKRICKTCGKLQDVVVVELHQ